MRMPRWIAILGVIVLGLFVASLGAGLGFIALSLVRGDDMIPNPEAFGGALLVAVLATPHAFRICWSEAIRRPLRPLDLRRAAGFAFAMVVVPFSLLALAVPAFRPTPVWPGVAEAAFLAWAATTLGAWGTEVAFQARREAAERRRVLVDPARLAAEQAKRPVPPRMKEKV